MKVFSAEEYKTAIAVMRAHSCEELADGFLGFLEQAERNGASGGDTPFAWVCYHHDMGVHINAIFDGEIEALRYAVGSGYLKVAPIGIGEIGNLP